MVNLTPHDAKTKVITLFKEPVIYLSPVALQKMNHIIDLNDKEVGWLGSAKRTDSGDLLLLDVFLFEQQVHATTCEITPEGLAKFGMELIEKDPSCELYNSIRVWGHSHVNMDTGASSQDNAQMKVFKDSGAEWFLRLIANKKGKMQFTFYDYKNSITVEDVQWAVIYPEIQGIREQIKAETAEKVKEITYTSTYSSNYRRQDDTGIYYESDYGYYGLDRRWHSWADFDDSTYPFYDPPEEKLPKGKKNNVVELQTIGEQVSKKNEKETIDKTDVIGTIEGGSLKEIKEFCKNCGIDEGLVVGLASANGTYYPILQILADEDIKTLFSPEDLIDIDSHLSDTYREEEIMKSLQATFGIELCVTDSSVKFITNYAERFCKNIYDEAAK